MNLFNLIIIAIALGMDAFSVAISVGARSTAKLTSRQVFRLSFHFGLFQMLMPLIGWRGGLTVTDFIGAYDHWVAFLLLGYVGGKMIWESLTKEKEEAPPGDPTKGLSLVMLSVATSIDALAVGFSLALLNVRIFYAALLIGVIAAVMTFGGLLFGKIMGRYLGNKVELIGGLLLIAIGIKILIDHLF